MLYFNWMVFTMVFTNLLVKIRGCTNIGIVLCADLDLFDGSAIHDQSMSDACFSFRQSLK